MTLELELDTAIANYKGTTYGEMKQDAFALATSNFRKQGYFVEFGAMTGKEYSNTYILEKDYEWSGIVSEPNPRFHDSLIQNRSCVVDNRAVFNITGSTVEFTCTEHGYSAIKSFTNRNGNVIQVETVTLNDLLSAHNAPDYIDFVSVDTEGSEFEILKVFDFDRYTVGAWAIEHNNGPTRQQIYDLMVKHEYQRVLTGRSRYDDWYINKNLNRK